MMLKAGTVKTKLAMVDLDGTLVDTLDANYRSYKTALIECGFELSKETYAKCCDGRSYKDFLPEIMGDISHLEYVHERKKVLYEQNLKYAVVNEHIKAILLAIKSEYYLALVTTASRRNVDAILGYFHLFELFDTIVTQEDMTLCKPAPDCYHMTREQFGILPENTIIFEDSETGIKAAVDSKCNVFCYKKSQL